MTLGIKRVAAGLVKESIEFLTLICSGLFFSNVVIHNSGIRTALLFFGSIFLYFIDQKFKRAGRRARLTLITTIAGSGALLLDAWNRSLLNALSPLLWIEGKGEFQLNQPYAVYFLALLLVSGGIARVGMKIGSVDEQTD